MMGSVKAHYECIRVLSETDFFDDLKNIDVPVLVMHGRTIRSARLKPAARKP